MSAAITGSLLRERDRRVDEQKDLRYQRLKRENEEISKQVFDARAEREEALTLAEHYRNLYQDTLDENETLRKEIEILRRDKMANAPNESQSSGSKECALELELTNLRARYDTLVKTHERLGELYKKDHEKWIRTKKWLLEGVPQGLSAAEREKASNDLVHKKKKFLQQFGLDADSDDGKENRYETHTTHSSSAKVLVVNSSDTESSPAKASCSTTEEEEPQGNTVLTPRPPLSRVPPPTQTPLLKQNHNVLPTPDTLPHNKGKAITAGIRRKSDHALTDDEPPAKLRRVSVERNETKKLGSSSLALSLAAASSAKAAQGPSTNDTISKELQSANTDTVRSQKRQNVGITPAAAIPVILDEDDNVFITPTLPASKIPQIPTSDAAAGPSSSKRMKYAKPTAETFSVSLATVSSSKLKQIIQGKDQQKTLPLEEYQKYKGRGRYAVATRADDEDDDPEHNKPLTSLFVIDPSRNGGVDHQYDEVVRNKSERKKMHGGDCLCCKDYYEAMGPMPPRLQPPMWRSPKSTPAYMFSSPTRSTSSLTTTPTKAKGKGKEKRPQTSPSASRHKSIEAHKNQISRHRHHWAPTSTPPKYWAIGFPNTQEVQVINEAAKEMHKRKVDNIRREAENVEKGKKGRWRRR